MASAPTHRLFLGFRLALPDGGSPSGTRSSQQRQRRNLPAAHLLKGKLSRQVAEWVLRRGGKIRFDHGRLIDAIDQIPSGDFAITHVQVFGKSPLAKGLTSKEIANELQVLPNLVSELILNDLSLTKDELGQLSKLRFLSIREATSNPPLKRTTRQIAEWVLKRGGNITVNGSQIGSIEQLPTDNFEISHLRICGVLPFGK